MFEKIPVLKRSAVQRLLIPFLSDASVAAMADLADLGAVVREFILQVTVLHELVQKTS